MKHILLATIAAGTSSHAAIVVSLPGNTETSSWKHLDNSNPYWAANAYPTAFPGTAPWPAAVAANGSGSQGSAMLMKVSGNGYFSGSSIYDAGGAGTFSLFDDSPVSNLANLVFQIDAGTSIGIPPTLNYNGGSQALAPDHSAQTDGSHLTFNFSTGQSFPTLNQAWQWDLTGLGVTSYQITWGSTPDNHLTQYEFNLAAGDTFVQVIPEPSTALLAWLIPSALFRRRR